MVLPTLPNVYCILTRHPQWKDVIAYDEFAVAVVKRRPPPFPNGAGKGEWNDLDDGRLHLWLAQNFGIEARDKVIDRAVVNAAEHARFHPVREYLSGLKWDGAQRLREWLQAYLGAESRWYLPKTGEFIDVKRDENNRLPPLPPEAVDYTGLVGKKFLIGAVARVYDPGCKNDCVLLLEGRQGQGKSSAAGVLADPWFTAQQIKIGDKDTYEVMRGQWFVELAELDALSRADVAAAKAFFSRSTDRFRSAYGRRAANVPRQGVFVGTVNHFQYLRDSSGNRRYWPVRCARVDLKDLGEERDQLWAEALHRYRAREPWWVMPEERLVFEAEQDARYVGDAWEAKIVSWLEGKGKDQPAPIQSASTTEIMAWALSLEPAKWAQAEQIRIGNIMERIGWDRRRDTTGARQWRYYRPPSQVVSTRPNLETEVNPQ